MYPDMIISNFMVYMSFIYPGKNTFDKVDFQSIILIQSNRG